MRYHLQRVKNIFHLLEALIANVYFRFPSRSLTVIGITGTDGKTTTSHLIYHVLSTSGKKCSIISSIHVWIAGHTFETGPHTTTPRAWTLQKLLRKAADEGDEYFVIETTSHALDQYRVWGVKYKAAVLTNVTEEHRFHHRNFQNYLDSKLKLLYAADLVLINKDGRHFSEVHKSLMRAGKIYNSFSLDGGDCEYVWPKDLRTSLPGEFNRQNVLASYACCRVLGLGHSQVVRAIGSFTSPKGRYDVIYHKDFTVIIDFAHTANSLQSILRTVRCDLKDKKGRLIHIFGAASERDDKKRPAMGKVSCESADVIILTEEDYRNEDFETICLQISEGFVHGSLQRVESDTLSKISRDVYTLIQDRNQAIRAAVSMAGKGDTIVATGKGHEKSLNRDGKEHVWDEYEAFEKALKLKRNKKT